MSETAPAGKYFGKTVERKEDPELITGDAGYVDDLEEPGMCHIAILRSQHGHAKINDIDTSRAEEVEGVIDVLTAEDFEAAALPTPGHIPVIWHFTDFEIPEAFWKRVIVGDRARYQGESIAVVIAEDRYTAYNARDQIHVDYEPLDAVVSPFDAMEADAPTLHDEAPDNVVFDWEEGDAEATDEQFEAADHTFSVELPSQRILPTSIETRGALATYSGSSGKLELQMTSQNPHLHRSLLSRVLDYPEHKIQVVAPDVGGGFGSKIYHYADEAITAWLAMYLERPVKWIAPRSEASQTDAHGRGLAQEGELAIDDDGTVRAVRVTGHVDLGAYVSCLLPALPTDEYWGVLSGPYDLNAAHCRIRGVLTNAAPVDAYRGANLTDATHLLERLMKTAATELGIDPVEIRRRNFISADEFPFETVTGMLYDSGDYEPALDRALEMVDYEALRGRQAKLREEGRYLGIGVASFIEMSGLGPSAICGMLGAQSGYWENSTIRVHPSGTVTAFCGTSGHGQGHETTFAQIVADKLGVPYDDVEVVEGDTDQIAHGQGTYASRSGPVGGGAVARGADKVVEKGRKIAAHQLEVQLEDIDFEDGAFAVTGAPDRSMTIQEIAAEAYLGHDLPDEMEPGLEETSFYDPENLTFPFGTHIAVVEIDPATGELEFVRYVGVDDCGEQINPQIVEGQVQGGVAQGIGQARSEAAVYDDRGNIRTATLLDYGLPKTNTVPELELDSTVTPSPHNPIGVKGVGEAGTLAAPPAVVNAVVDALEPFGIDHVNMPVTDEVIWTAIQESETGPGGES
ncbi:xanthine dehydrogenase family protein molybdopterin-binding subunit [Salinigranum marinum]|uniref:xanthine dehydrogenase family protein molybdopterin-binding subunit n=1 Tax=Salinigranum marinum TaxID=1515595 RepID=UPI002989B52C|nr:molybdopterin cofactor-binding domain-containing protein [Salinigranum marinum]